jgi:hypothetical protein
MENWILNRLFQQGDQSKPQFAFQGTVSWMRSLSILVNINLFTDEKLKKHYSSIQRRKTNQQADNLVLENVLMAFHNLSALDSMNRYVDKRSDIVRAAVIAWYYSIYCISSAMVAAASGANPETHTKTAKIWQKDIVDNQLVIKPFALSLKTLIKKNVETEIKHLKKGNTYDINMSIRTEEEAWGGVFSYLSGTAE